MKIDDFFFRLFSHDTWPVSQGKKMMWGILENGMPAGARILFSKML
jgi:hypothetical protein